MTTKQKRKPVSTRSYPVENRMHWRAVATGEFRQPIPGEYYLSGAIPMAYRCLGKLNGEYHIAVIRGR